MRARAPGRDWAALTTRPGLLLQIWDTAGQERFRSVTHAYYRDAHGELGLAKLPRFLLGGRCPGCEEQQCGGCSARGGWQGATRGSAAVLTGPLPPALLLLYDVTNKASFDSIQVSGFHPSGEDRLPSPQPPSGTEGIRVLRTLTVGRGSSYGLLVAQVWLLRLNEGPGDLNPPAPHLRRPMLGHPCMAPALGPSCQPLSGVLEGHRVPQPGLSSPPTGLADGDPGVRPA